MTPDDLLLDGYETDLHRAELRVAALEADVEVYRTITQQALHALHQVVKERDRLRVQHRDDREAIEALHRELAARYLPLPEGINYDDDDRRF